ncbi:MAG: glutathione S-transferase family protein [Pseudomonadota bacterium]|jgi:glutathione S-transferase
MAMTLYGAPLSPFVRKVELFLQLKGIDCARNPVTPFALPEGYERINPLKRIPALEVDGRYLADSAVICRFLEDLYPDPELIATDPWLKARIGWLEKFADYELAPAITATAFRHRVLLKSMGTAYDEAAVAAALAERAPPLYQYLDQEIGTRVFLVGDRLSLADIAIVSQFMNAAFGGEAPDAQRWPRLARYLARHFDSAPFAEVFASHRQLVDRMLARAR